MNEQLPLKRIFSVLSAGVLAAAVICAPGISVSTAAGDLSQRTASEMQNTEETDETKADASVKALNHEENNRKENETTEKYEAPVWKKAGLSDYREPLELDELIPTAVPDDQVQADAAAQQGDGSYVINVNAPGAYTLPSAQGLSSEQYEPDTFYIRSYGKGHGVGMSQNGANSYSKYLGWNYGQILAHYYPGTTIEHRAGDGTETITVKGVTGSVVDVLSRVCEAEVGASFSDEAIKAQAVAAYSFIKYYNGSTDGMSISSRAPSERIVNLVREVAGEALYYNGNYALAMFCASSGGCTASNKDINYEDIPYLRSVECDIDAVYDSEHYGKLETHSADWIYNKLVDTYHVSLSYEDRDSWIQLVPGDGGYIVKVIIGGQKTVKGYDFAQNVLGLRTPKFTIEHT